MVLLMCVLWAVCAGALRGQSRVQSRGPVHRLPLFKHAPEPLVAREMFRPVPHKSPLPHGLASLLIPGPEQKPGYTQASPLGLDVWCGLRQISVRVDRLRLRHWSSPGKFRLSSCPVSAASPRYLYFHRGLGECGRDPQVVGGQLVYRYSLSYVTPLQGSVLRVPPLDLPLSCHYNRFHYSYRVGYQPLARPTSFLKSVQSRAIFSLRVCNSLWEVLPPAHEAILGEPVHFVAQAGALLAGERLYVDSCHVSSSKDPSSSPRVDIITNHGCMTDSVRADSGSHFVSRGPGLLRGPSELRFSVDSLLFTTAAQVLFLHCSMSVGLQPSASSKSCTYSRATGRWQELDTSSSVCSCCESVCGAPVDPVSTLVSSAAWHLAQQQENQHQVSLKSERPGLREDQHQVSLESEGPGLREDQHHVSLKSGGPGLREDQHQVSLKSGGPGLREDQHQVSLKSGGPGLKEDQHQGAVSLKTGGPGLTEVQHQGAVSLKSGGPGLTEDRHQVSLKSEGPGLRKGQHQGDVSLKNGGPDLTEGQHQVAVFLKSGGQADMQRDGIMETRPQHSSSLFKSVLTNQTSAQNQRVSAKPVNASRPAALDYMD